MSVHLVLYSNNEPYDTTKRLTVETVCNFTQKNIIIHDFNLAKIQKKEWYRHIRDLPSVPVFNGRRDGFYNCWKAFIVRDVYAEMQDGDILYYVDCSSYFRFGFTENIDKLCDLASNQLRVAGSVASDIRNNSVHCCDNLMVWNKIIKSTDNSQALNKMHVLNSWFLFKKCESNDGFIRDWAHFSVYTDADAVYPLAVYHHTVDQSIFNILVVKYNFPVFFHPNYSHADNKNKNLALNVTNQATDPSKYLVLL
jgi:hypothetical protein